MGAAQPIQARQGQHRGRLHCTALLESADVEFEHPPTVEEAFYVWAQHPVADFADGLLTARAAHLGRSRFLSFDVGAARLPGVGLLA